ncbi:MAG TPA: DUF559 domain-containing protein [Micromonosporaceae bacterium]
MPAGLWRGRDLIAATGWQTVRTRVEHGELRRVRRGVYTDRTEIDDEDALQALFLCLPPEAMLARQSAARRYGLDIPGDGAVHIHLPPTVARPRLPGLVVHHGALPVGEPTLVRGVPCVPPVRCAIDLARTLRRFDALPVLDAMVGAGLATSEELYVEACRHAGLKGVRQARELALLADGRAECRQESQLRLVLLDGGLPPPEPQIWVRDRHGVLRYRIDLGYRERRIGVEYDGVTHLDRARFRRDRERMNWLAAEGWTMRYFTDRDLYHRPDYVVAAVRAALA